MRESGPSKSKDFLIGAALGALAGLIVKDLDLTTVVSYWGPRTPLVLVAAILGGAMWLTSLRRLLVPVVTLLSLLWLCVAFTPLTHWMATGLPREDPLQKADAVFVLASGLQSDGEFSVSSMPRLVRGLELVGEGWAPRLILSELPRPRARYGEAATKLITSLGLDVELLTVGPTRNTHDEAVAVAALARERSFEHILVVTSPSHTRRAAAALEAEGVRVTSVASQQIDFDIENLDEPFDADNHLRAFNRLLHEHVGLFYYRQRGWIK